MLVAEISSLLKCCNPFALLSLLNAIMAVRIRLFQSVRKYQFLMGIYVTDSNERAPFNYKNVIFLGSVAQLLISSLLFFVFQADSFREYANSFYATITAGSTCSYYVVQMLQIANFDMLTKQVEHFVEQSNSFHSTLYNSTKKFFHRIFFLWCILYVFPFRCDQTAPVLCQIECEHRAIHLHIAFNQLFYGDRCDYAAILSLLQQLFHPGFGKGIILFALSGYVSSVK